MGVSNVVKNKIAKMSKEELLVLINDLSECNNDVASYLNNIINNVQIDSKKYIRQISKCFENCYFRIDKAMEIYLKLRKTTKDYSARSKVGLSLLEFLIMDFETGNYSQSKCDRIEKVTIMLCEDIAKVENNVLLKKELKKLMINDYLEDMMIDIYYSYFNVDLDKD